MAKNAQAQSNSSQSNANSNENSEKPSISLPKSPSMPSVSSPKVGGGFYAPNSKDFYKGVSSSSAGLGTSSKKSNSDSEKSKSNNQNQKSENQSDKNSNQTSENKSKSILQNGLAGLLNLSGNNINGISASDMISLNQKGVFNSLSDVNVSNSPLISEILENELHTSSSQNSQNLKNILGELKELKEKVEKLNIPDKKDAFIETKKEESKLLRFIVNSYDVLSACSAIYFSESEKDGTFLVTGDRKIIQNNKALNETFYFYFHPEKEKDGIRHYNVTTAVSQSEKNEKSLLYKITEKEVLKAERTGNLIILRYTDEDLNVDMLLSMKMKNEKK